MKTDRELLKLAARAAGIKHRGWNFVKTSSDENIYLEPVTMEQIERFAALVAAAEREECAKLCESLFDPDDDSCNEADLCVAAIRARSQQ